MPVVALLSVASCSAPEEHHAEKEAGVHNAPTFVSLNPCLDAILVEVADPDQILALSHYSHDPQASSMPQEQARKFAITGGSVEEVLSLEPTHVLASNFIAPATQNALTKLGHDAQIFGIASDVQTSTEQIRRIAALAGHEARAEALIARIDAVLNTDNSPRNIKPLSAILWQPGQIVPGNSTLVSELMLASGFTNHASDNGMVQADFLSLEALLANPPDVLLIASGDGSRNYAQSHDAISQMKDTHIASFSPSLLYCAGPTIIRAVDRLEAIRLDAEGNIAP